jgi:hypothetical protein
MSKEGLALAAIFSSTIFCKKTFSLYICIYIYIHIYTYMNRLQYTFIERTLHWEQHFGQISIYVQKLCLAYKEQKSFSVKKVAWYICMYTPDEASRPQSTHSRWPCQPCLESSWPSASAWPPDRRHLRVILSLLGSPESGSKGALYMHWGGKIGFR